MWTINGIRIFVERFRPKKDAIYAELNNLGGNSSIIHHFGSKSTKYSMAGRIVGFDTVDSIQNIINSGLPVVVSGNAGFVKTMYLGNFNYDWENTIAQTFDPTHSCTDPVFKFTMELIEQ